MPAIAITTSDFFLFEITDDSAAAIAAFLMQLLQLSNVRGGNRFQINSIFRVSAHAFLSGHHSQESYRAHANGNATTIIQIEYFGG